MSIAPIIRLETVDSTMDELAALLSAGAVEPWTAVMADYQRSGRGRAGRRWQAPAGTALLSTIYAPIAIDSARVGMLAIAAGLAVDEALARHDIEARLKWPNDVLVNDRKVAGILISNRFGGRIDASIGVGLNLSSAPPEGIALTEICQCPPSAAELLVAIRAAMSKLWSELEGGFFGEVSNRWNMVAAWAGEVVAVPGDDACTGRLVGVDDWGRLHLDTAAGELRLDQSEIVRGPRPQAAAPYT